MRRGCGRFQAAPRAAMDGGNQCEAAGEVPAAGARLKRALRLRRELKRALAASGAPADVQAGILAGEGAGEPPESVAIGAEQPGEACGENGGEETESDASASADADELSQHVEEAHAAEQGSDDDSDEFGSARSATETEEGHAEREGDSEGEEEFRAAEHDGGNVSARDVNVAKAEAIRSGITPNLTRLGFRPTLTNAALDAGVLEVEHFDGNCELAYVDIFLLLVKMIGDAHLDVLEGAAVAEPLSWSAAFPDADSEDLAQSGRLDFLPFKWPVFDMAQFEFGNARNGTCFDSVCVLINLPKMAFDRSEELMELLSCNLFCMIGDPIQVVVPSVTSTGRTKGYAFLEFDDPSMAKRCAAAVDGLTWGRGAFGRIRASMFRQYQVKTSPGNETASSSPNGQSGTHYATAGQLNRRGNRYFEDRHVQLHEHSVDNADQENEYEDEEDEEGAQVELSRRRNTRLHQLAERLSAGMSSLVLGGDTFRGDLPVANRADQRQFPLREISEREHVRGYELSFSSEEESDLESNSSCDSVLEFQTDDQQHFTRPSIESGTDSQSFASPQLLHLTRSHSAREFNGHLYDHYATASLSGQRTVDMDELDDQEDYGYEGEHQEAYNQFNALYAPDAAIDDQAANFADFQLCDESDKPWRAYCSELVAQNREMQEQIAIARRRIVQLGHNNQKLHLLIDRVERDRDGLMFENDLLQNQLQGAESTERHHDSLLKELMLLRKRLKSAEAMYSVVSASGVDYQHHPHRREGWDQHAEQPTQVQSSFSRFANANAAEWDAALGDTRLEIATMDDLKQWERSLEDTLMRVRSAKEEKAVELQKRLDRQVEEQQELKLCVICLASDKSILCLPCRHLCMCASCSLREEVSKCPMCRLPIEETIQVYA